MKIIALLFSTTLIGGCVANVGASERVINTVSQKTVSQKAVTPMILQSTSGFAATESRLRDAIGSRDFNLFTVVDHGAGARSVGRDIGQSKLFVFGNPEGGTPLMEANAAMGLELPLKVLIHTEPDGTVHVGHTNIVATARAYGIADQDARLMTIQDTLHAVVREAAGTN